MVGYFRACGCNFSGPADLFLFAFLLTMSSVMFKLLNSSLNILFLKWGNSAFGSLAKTLLKFSWKISVFCLDCQHSLRWNPGCLFGFKFWQGVLPKGFVVWFRILATSFSSTFVLIPLLILVPDLYCSLSSSYNYFCFFPMVYFCHIFWDRKQIFCSGQFICHIVLSHCDFHWSKWFLFSSNLPIERMELI